MQAELKVRKIIGRTYLNENRLAEALDIFSKILLDYPEDLETLLILGNCYLASGDGKTAKNLFVRAQKLHPDNTHILRQIKMAEEIEEDSGIEEPTPTDLEAVARMLQRLTGDVRKVDEKDVVRAAFLLDKIINSDYPARLVADHLDEIDELMPALVELNIRQAHADGKPELVQALRALQQNIDHQLVAKDGDLTRDAAASQPALPAFKGHVLILYPYPEEKSHRMQLIKSALDAQKISVSELGEYLPSRDRRPDVVITSNPHTNPRLLDSLSALSAAGIPVLLDLDTDFEKQPVTHQDYNTTGLGTQNRGSAYTAMLPLASMVSVTSEVQAASMKGMINRVAVIPDGWSNKNELWEKNAAIRQSINLGWAAPNGQLEDLAMIRRFIVRIIREFPNTRITIIGSPQAYRLFESLPEHRRMYLPLVSKDEYPYLLSQLDVLMIPLRNTPFNLSLPDTAVMEASAKGIPWLASPIPSFRRWSSGGVISESLNEWHLNLRHLVMDRELRANLSKSGKSAAKPREMGSLSRTWLEIIQQITSQKQA